MVATSLLFALAGHVQANAPETSLRPESRPAELTKPTANTGSICGFKDIRGRKIAPIVGPVQGCGIDAPVAVRSVAGIALSTPASMDCNTAKTLRDWTAQSVKQTFGTYRGGVREFHVVAHYVCRPRNNRVGAKISEHGKGRAIDIAGFRMRDGTTISLIRDWGKGRPGRILRTLHREACGRFGTVLGPEANAAHRDHFHFDTAKYRGGAYCR